MNKLKTWFWGIFFVLAAVLLVVNQVTGFAQVGFWTILATIVLVAVLIESIPSVSFGGILFSLAMLYALYQKPLGFFYISPWALFFASVLAGIGLSIVFRPVRRKKNHAVSWGSSTENAEAQAVQSHGAVHTDGNDDDNHPYASVRVGASSRYLHSTALEYGQFDCSVGALEIYFDEATLAPGGAVIEVSCSMGGIELYIPKSWNVEVNIVAILAGVDNDTASARPDPGAPRLAINGTVRLGGISIHYI